MNKNKLSARGGLGLLLFLLLSRGHLQACTVPVFRYALERWPAEPYPVYQSAESELSMEQMKGLLQTPLYHRVLSLQPSPEAKQVRVGVPLRGLEGKAVVEVDDVTAADVEKWLLSPMRIELARRILSGETGVCVLLTSGDEEKDAAARDLVEKSMREMERVLKIPAIAAEDVSVLTTEKTELKVKFSLLELDPQDPAEHFFVRNLLLISGRDKIEALTEPVVFPIYGRGRAIGALQGEHLRRENLNQVFQFLVSSCSCEIKALNPGVDLLIGIEWNRYLKGDLPEKESGWRLRPPPREDPSLTTP